MRTASNKLKTAPLLAAAIAAAVVPLAGCSSWFQTTSKPAPEIRPDDFVGEPQVASAQAAPDQTTLVSADTPDETDGAINGSTPVSDNAVAIDAMVGHINGEAVYANQIFDVNLVAQLESFGRRFDPNQFQDAAAAAIMDRLQGVVINKLILGEAERNLKDFQRRSIDFRVNAEREELLRFYGQGSVAKAKAEFLKDRAKTLDQHLIDFREELIIGSYIRLKVMPKIVVNQRDVERYYNDNQHKYNTPDMRIIRLIRAADDSASKEVASRLERGETFERVAKDPELNTYNSDNAGIFSGGDKIPGDMIIGLTPVNDAILTLKEGQHAGPVAARDQQFYVQVVAFEPGQTVPLTDAQIAIEETLRAQQFEKHALRFRMDLMQRGSFSDPADMSRKLVEIALSRYDR
ncbi:MAG: peptidyl-prolyl cis-trans isomerase [Phycisphaeraceae bacterium]